ncbi:M15 family metallopeptidase [Macrococcus animalis]|uniref:M15 family metallopeptidase n=1 Tax=Macrococcus animalis TaxID=3395467 RepID=UPI0039BE987C
MKKSIILLCVLLLAACNNSNTEKASKTSENAQKTVGQTGKKSIDKNDSNQDKSSQHKKVVKEGITYIDNILIVNKEIALPKDYAPGDDPKALDAINKLMQEGNASGLNIVLRSGFRSYDVQIELYNGYVARDGQKKADTYSARPGHSEHQSGLAFDLGNVAATDDFKSSFENTPEGKWLKAHAHEYGFIIRYPKGKTDITGYQYEPWHLRYLGKENAKKVLESGLTLEEFVGLK